MVRQKFDLHIKFKFILPNLFLECFTNQISLIKNNYQFLNFTEPFKVLSTKSKKMIHLVIVQELKKAL